MKNEHIVVEITEPAKNTSFVDCEIYGKVKNAGQYSTFIRTKICKFKKNHPFWFYLGNIGIVLGIPASIIALFNLFSKS